MTVDVADHMDVEENMRSAVKDFGTPDIVVANAGVGYADRFENIPYEEFDALMKTNVYGVRNTIAALLPSVRGRGGHVVIVSSAAGLMGMYGYSAYGTSKFALVGFAESLRSELKPLGIPVTLVCPAEVDTPFVPREAQKLPRGPGREELLRAHRAGTRGQGHREGPFEEQVPRDTRDTDQYHVPGSPPHRRTRHEDHLGPRGQARPVQTAAMSPSFLLRLSLESDCCAPCALACPMVLLVFARECGMRNTLGHACGHSADIV